jgi:16S rRNA (cytosine1402-N4)-methyltransferase
MKMPVRRMNYHTPVMVEQVIRFLEPAAGRVYLDGTLGTGGHTEALLEKSAPTGRVLGIDTDAESIEWARQRLVRYGERVVFIHARFDQAREVLSEHGVDRVHGAVLDLGLSRVQLEMPGRGFSFLREDPLDMRMDRSRGNSAAQILNRLSEEEMAHLFHTYGEERWARRIARAVVTTRKMRGDIQTTLDLEKSIWHALPRKLRRPAGIHPATRTFQALRIVVNRELESLQAFLDDLPDLLHRGGRCCIISFHSLEDRIVKERFRAWDGSVVRRLQKKVVRPDPDEVAENRLSRSARLRVVERL